MARVIQAGLRRDHQFYERMAHAVTGHPADVPFWQGTRQRRRPGEDDDIAIIVYEPREQYRHIKPPVIVFGNTRLDIFDAASGNEQSLHENWQQFRADLSADFFPLGVGLHRYCFNEGSIKLLIERLRRRYDKNVVFVGHSLGGALAQLVACRMPQYVQSVVTFQSPMTTSVAVGSLYTLFSDDLAELMQLNTWHYRVAGDEIIQQAGEMVSPGTIVKVAYGQTFLEDVVPALIPYFAHTKLIFQPFPSSPRSVAELTELAGNTFVLITTESIGEQDLDDETMLSSTIEFVRSLGPSISDALLAVLLGGGAAAFHGGPELVGTIRKILYVLDWDINVTRFNDNPIQGERRYRSLSFEWPVPRREVAISTLLSSDQIRRMRQQLRRYTRGTVLRRR